MNTFFLLCFAFFSALIPQIAFAYLDPGTGSYVIQVGIGLIAGAFFVIKNYWVVIRGYFSKIFNKDKK